MYEWESKLNTISNSMVLNEKIFEIMEIFYDTFPCKIIQVYQYSILNKLITGVLSYESGVVKSISHIQESMSLGKHIHEYLLKNEVKYFHDNKFQLAIGKQNPLSMPISNMLLLPIALNGVPIAFMTGVNIDFQLNDERMEEVHKFRDNIINVLKLKAQLGQWDLTEKELMVMEYMANGLMTKEISKLLYISEATVKYFLKNVMLKTNASNRTEAVAKLMRVGVIS